MCVIIWRDFLDLDGKIFVSGIPFKDIIKFLQSTKKMQFCDECGAMMLPSTVNNRKVFKCKCGYTKPLLENTGSYVIKTKIEQPIRNEVTNLTEVMKWKEENLRSSIKDFKCRKCGYDKAHLETRQTRSADEGMTHFITCLKCGKMRKIGS